VSAFSTTSNSVPTLPHALIPSNWKLNFSLSCENTAFVTQHTQHIPSVSLPSPGLLRLYPTFFTYLAGSRGTNDPRTSIRRSKRVTRLDNSEEELPVQIGVHMAEAEGRAATMPGEDIDGASGEINRADTFQHLQAAFPSTQRPRPPLMEYLAGSEEQRVPLKPSKVSRRESKGVLRGIFTRNKVDKNVALPVLEEPSATPNAEEPTAENALPHGNPLKRVSTLPAPTPATPSTPKAASKSYRMNLRSKSVKHIRSTPKLSPKSSTKSSPKPPTRTSAAWDPPPLFQAYPQAIKHATLSASALSADSILRISNHKRANSVRDDFAQTDTSVDGPEKSAAAKKAEKVKNKHRRQISGSISKADWTQKIFVLVTSGYLLQYAGEGSFDRLPEKMMQLGKDSVAFASDVIPGKHWVLQISQSMNADGTPTADSRSLLSRLAFRGADYRRTATSLLLVLNSAEDMDSWIAVVRREIEALGGKKHVSETGKPKPDDKVMQLKAQPSHRYLIQRDPDRFYHPVSPSSPSFGRFPSDVQLQDKLEDAASALSRPLSTIRPSTSHQSIADSLTSHDDRRLESLRDSGNRLSYMSSGQRTLITSQCSSTTSSPTRERYPSFDDFPPKISIEDARPRPNAAVINERRRSMQTMHVAVLETPPHPKTCRHSTYTIPTRPPRGLSPSTPNFSTPKRLSRVLVPETPPIPTIVTTNATPSNLRNSILKGNRKGSPAALDLVRPLSPVEDSPSPSKRAPSVLTPIESSLKIVQQVKASVVSIPPRSPSAITSPISPVGLPRRMSSLIPRGSAETAHLDFQFPQRFSSMQALREAVDLVSGAPLGPAPLTPADLTTPLPVSPYYPDHEPEIEKGTLSPLPILANSKQKLRRPTSIQIRRPSASPSFTGTKSPKTSHVSSTRRPMPISPTQTSSAISVSSSASIAVLSPSFQRLKVQAHPKALGNRRSMPTLVNGPPLAPPPDCALPPLPPGSAGLQRPKSVRKSLRL
jgi:hypothetical protein